MALTFSKKMGRPSARPDNETFAKLYQEKTSREIAEMYGVQPSTVRWWASEIRRAARAGETEARADE